MACSKAESEDPCERASENAQRLVRSDDAARERYGANPLPVERCRSENLATTVKSCIAYASSMFELEMCSPNALLRDNVARE